MSRIKVTHIITKLELGGAQNNTIYTVTHLDKNKFAPALISGPGGILDEKVKSQFSEVIFCPHLKRPVSIKNDFLALLELLKVIKKLQPDIVHTHSSKAGILGRVAAKLAGVKVIIHTYHGFGFNPEQNFFVRNFYIFLEKLVATITDRIIFVSQQNWHTARSYHIGKETKYLLIRSGIEIEKFLFVRRKYDILTVKKELGIPENYSVILTIGPFKPQKNLFDFVAVARKVREKKSDTIFLVVGDGELRPELEKRIAEISATDYIKLLGWQNDVARIMAVSDIFVLTSLWEGLPRSLVEAMVAGVVPVVYAVDGCQDIVISEKNGFLIPVKNTALMAEKILKLLTDKTLYQKISAEAEKSISQQFSIDLMVKQQEKLYKELLEWKK